MSEYFHFSSAEVTSRAVVVFSRLPKFMLPQSLRVAKYLDQFFRASRDILKECRVAEKKAAHILNDYPLDIATGQGNELPLPKLRDNYFDSKDEYIRSLFVLNNEFQGFCKKWPRAENPHELYTRALRLSDKTYSLTRRLAHYYLVARDSSGYKQAMNRSVQEDLDARENSAAYIWDGETELLRKARKLRDTMMRALDR